MAAWFVLPTPAYAHRLEVDYRVLPGKKIRVESWFDRTNDVPRGARVQIFGSEGRLLTEGRLDEKGEFFYVFTFPIQLRVVVIAGEGHRAEVTVPAGQLAQNLSSQEQEPKTRTMFTAADEESPPDRRPRVSMKDALIGIGFLLALAAFILSVRNAQHLREMRKDKKVANQKLDG